MFRVCRIKSNGRILEMQSGGKVDRLPAEVFETEAEYQEYLAECNQLEEMRRRTLIQNAVNAGYQEDDIECAYMTEAEYEAAQNADPVLAAQKQEGAAEKEKRAKAKSGMKSLAGWADWTPEQAENWIDGNVQNLANARTALKAMAKAIVYLRDHTQITK